MAAYVASLSATMDDQVSAGANAAVATLGRLADAADKVSSSLDNTSKVTTRAGASANTLINTLDPVTKAANALAAAQDKLSSATATLSANLAAGGDKAAAAEGALATLAARVRVAQTAYDQLTGSAAASATQLSGMVATTSELSSAMATAQRYQDQLNASFGIAANQADTYAARAADLAAYGNALDAVRAKYNPVFAVSKQYETQLNAISDAEKTGAISASEAAAARDNATAAFSRAASVTDLFTASNAAAAAQAEQTAASLAAQAAATAKAADYQATLNARMGIAASTSDGYEQRAADIAAYGAALDATRAKFDPVFNISKQYEATLEEISIAEKNGAISSNIAASARATATQTFQANIDAANRSAVALDTASHSTAGFYREILVLGHEVVTGNFNRIPGSLMVLAERSGNLETIFEKLISLVTTLPGILTLAGVAGVAAMGYLAISSSNAIANLISLQDHLKATRDDYVALGSEATAAAQGAARTTPGLSVTDATQAAGIIAGSPAFAGTQAQLQSLVVTAADIAKVFNETVDKAAADLAVAMVAPGDAADKLVGKLRGMTQATADSIKMQDESGDRAGAFAKLLDIESQAVDGTSQKLSPLRQAMHDLGTAFEDDAHGAGGFFSALGDFTLGVLFSAIEGFAALLRGINDVFAAAKAGVQYLGGAVGVSSGSGSVSGMISSIGAQLGASSGVVSLAQRIAPVESPHGQFNADGSVVTSGAGALGAMQVMPGNANGNNLSTLQGNVTAAETLLIHLYTKYAGNETLVAAAYNWGEGNVDNWLKAGANPASLPQETQKYVAAVTGSSTVGSSVPAVSAAGTADNSLTDQALQKSTGSLAAQSDALKSQIILLTQVQKGLQDTGQVGSDAWNRVTTQLHAATLQYSELQDPLTKTLTEISDQRDAQNDLAEAYGKGSDAVADATAHTQAFNAAVKAVGLQSTEFDGAVEKLTVAYRTLADASQAAAVAQQTAQNKDALEYLQAETDSIGENDGARNLMLSHLKAEQELRTKNVSDLSAEGQAYLASVDAISAQTSALAKSQQVMSELEGIATSSFDSISSAITNAFAQGGKSALDFGNLARTVFSQIVADIAKIGVLNPILNSLFGGSRTTLSDVQGLLGGLGGIDSGSVAGTVTALPASTIGGGLSATTSTASIPAYSGGIGGAMSTPLFGTATVGSALGGVAGGFGIGSTLNGLIGGNSTGGSIGSLAGAAAGAAIGSVVPVIGTLIGGLVGGAAGGLLGGLFGNSKPSDFGEYSQVSLSTGAAAPRATSTSSGKEYSSTNQDAATNLASTIYAGAAAVASAFNLSIGGTGGVVTKVGNRDGIYAQYDNGTKVTAADTTAGAASVVNGTVSQIIDKVGTSLDATASSILKKIDYSNSNATTEVADLAAALTNGKLDATQAAALPKIDTTNAASAINELSWIKSTYEATVNSATNQGTIATQTAAVNASFTDLIAHAQRLGLATEVLTTAQNEQVQAINTAAATTIAASGAAVRAASQKQNGDMLTSQLTSFDASAAQQQQALVTEFQGLFGDAYKSQANYVYQSGLLTQNLAAQRQDLITSAAQAQASTIAASAATITAAAQKQNGDSLGSSLTSFDASAAQEQQQLDTEFQTLFGDAYKSQASYVAQTALLTQTLAGQRADLIASAQAAQAQTIAASRASITAAAQKQNGDSLGSSLTSFDASAAQQKQQLDAEFQGLFGDAYKSQADYVQQTALLTATISQQRQDLVDSAALAATTTMHTTDAAWVSNITAGWKAQATIFGLQGTASGNAQAAAENQDADLANFDAQSKTAVDQYSAQLTAAYGKSYTTTAVYAQQMVDLENSLAEQRLAIQANYASQAKAAQTSAESSAASVISGLAQYAAGLATSSASPLNAQAQYALAQKQYQADLAAAQGGSTTALGALQNDSSAFLTASQNVNGSGAGYVADFTSVLNALQTVANTAQDALTQDFMAAQIENQTDVLTAALGDLKAQLVLVRAELQQANARPA